MVSTYKIFFFDENENSSIFKKNIFLERENTLVLKVWKYFREKRSVNIYAVDNKNYEPLFWRSHGVVIAHEFCHFMKIMNLCFTFLTFNER